MKTNEKHIWFPAKKYGWGWGPPCAWQGWLALAMFVILLSATGFLTLPGGHFGLWIATVFALAIAMFVVCFAKGEAPHWRWGGSDGPQTRSSADRLAELDDLHRRRLISDSEYQTKRQDILNKL